MNYKKLLSHVTYRALVKGPKRNYHVLLAPQYCVLISPKPQDDCTGNYTIVPMKALEFIVNKLGGKKGIPTTEVFNSCKGSMFFPDKLATLTALYALIGLKGARIARQHGTKLFFNIWKNWQAPTAANH
jgi:hypothetical protein